MSKTTIKWAILGTSFISEVMAQAIHASEDGELMAIGSRCAQKGRAFSEKFSVPQCYQDYHALMRDKNIDAVYVGLPNHLHKEWMLHCADAGKHVLCEKPFVVSVPEAQEVMSVVEAAKIICMEALMYRHHPFIKKMQEVLASKVIGDVKLYHAVYTANIADVANPAAGGAIRNLGCYPVSLVRLLAQAEPVSIVGSGRANVKTGNDHQASVMLTFPDGAMAMVSTADDMDMVWQFEVYGTKGHLRVVSNPWMPKEDNNRLLIYRHKDEMPEEIVVKADRPLYTYQIDSMNQQIRANKAGDGIPLQDSLHNTHVLETWRNQVLT